MKKVMMLLSAGIVLLLLTSGMTISATGYQDINATDVKLLMEKENALVVFPLSPMEFDHKHIKGSVNIIASMLEYELPADKEKTIVFYCLGVKCVASWRAAEKAVELGYKNVYAFREGLPGWEQAGYPLESTEKLPDVAVETITTSELAKLLHESSEELILLDINLDEDAQKFHIDHAKRKHIPLDELNVSLPQLPKDKKIVVMCLKGKRSATAVKYLIGRGYEDVVMVTGGLQQWVLDGRPVMQEVAAK